MAQTSAGTQTDTGTPGVEGPGLTASPRFASSPARPTGIPAVIAPQPTVTLIDGTSFCVSRLDGGIDHGLAQGLFVHDTRVLSTWTLLADGQPIEPLTALHGEPFECRFVGRAPRSAGSPESTVVVVRHRLVGQGLREEIIVRNYGGETVAIDLDLVVDADFADVFEVKDGRIRSPQAVARATTAGGLLLSTTFEGEERAVHISSEDGRSSVRGLQFTAIVEPQGIWRATAHARPSVNGAMPDAAHEPGHPTALIQPARRMQDWRDRAPRLLVENPVLEQALETSHRDIGALRIIDAERPDDDVVAAGAPWFMALFGRDSLLTSWMMMPFAPDLALGTLRTLARLQGTEVNLLTDEHPGQILHEVRLGADLSLVPGGETIYYGSIDSTPLFVMVAAHALHWGVPAESLLELRPAIERAVAWIERYGDRDGDGFVEYKRGTTRGLENQGWKDSVDSMGFSDGRLASAPIAPAEAQGYCYAALLGKADLDDAWGAHDSAIRLRERAAELKRRFHEAYWLPELGFYAMALDESKRPLDVVSSNIGHCLWTGIVDESVFDQVRDRMMAPEMFTGFGLRTLSSQAPRFNPASYHNGSVWPHDTILGAAGLARYGDREAANRVVGGLLDALESFGDRLPELFCGFERTLSVVPVPYPVACSPQAWAAAAPFEMLRIALGLNADVPRGRFEAAAAAPIAGQALLRGIRLGASRIDVVADSRTVTVTGLPEGVELHRQ